MRPVIGWLNLNHLNGRKALSIKQSFTLMNINANIGVKELIAHKFRLSFVALHTRLYFRVFHRCGNRSCVPFFTGSGFHNNGLCKR